MKQISTFAATLATTLIMGSPAIAADYEAIADPSGFVLFADIYGGWTKLKSGTNVIGANEDDKYGLLGGNGSLMTSFGRFNVQLDVFGETNTDKTSAPVDDTYTGALGAGLHVNMSPNDMVTFGAFGALAGVGIQDTDGTDRDTTAFILGGEGMVKFDLGEIKPIVFLQGGFLDSKRDSDDAASIRNAGFIRGGLKTTIADRFTLQGDLAYAKGKMDTDDDTVKLFAWGVRGEFNAQDILPLPVSFFVEYDGAKYKQPNENDDLTDHTVMLGISFRFGGNNSAASARRFDLPRFYRWVGQTGGPLE